MFYKINLILLLILGYPGPLAAQDQIFQDPFLQNEQVDSVEQETQQENAKSQKSTNVSYANFRDYFNRFCFYLVADGKHSEWNSAIDKARAINDQCKACRSLYKSLSCKSKGSQINKKVTMPATELLAVVSEIFRTIAGEDALKNQTTIALNPVLEDLKQIKEVGSKEYFEILTEYIKTPLAQAFQSNQDTIKAIKKAQQQKQLDNLF